MDEQTPPRPGLGMSVARTALRETHAPIRESTVSGSGIFGALSPLPPEYTGQLLWWHAEGAHQPEQLLAALQGTLQRLTLQVAGRSRPTAETADNPHPCRQALRALVAHVGVAGLDESRNPAMLPLWCTVNRGRAGLLAVLERLLPGCPVQVEPLVERRFRVAAEDRARLGQCRARLGSALIGERVTDRGKRFRVRLGPVTAAQAESVLFAQSDPVPVLRDAIRAYAATPLECELCLIVAPDVHRAVRPGDAGSSALGRNTWMLGQGREKPLTVSRVFRT